MKIRLLWFLVYLFDMSCTRGWVSQTISSLKRAKRAETSRLLYRNINGKSSPSTPDVSIQSSGKPQRRGAHDPNNVNRLFTEKRKEASVEQKKYGKYMNAMVLAVKQNDFAAGKQVYDEHLRNIKLQTQNNRVPFIINTYLSLFHKKEHLPSLIELINDLRSKNLELSEIAYLALVRCHCAAGEIQIAWRYALEMVEKGYESRVRAFQPFFDAHERNLAVEKQLELISYMREHNVPIRGEQLQTVLRSYAVLRHREPQRVDTIYPRIQHLLHSLCNLVQGLPGDQLTILASLINQCSEETTKELGLLVADKEELEGAMISDADLGNDGSILAYNISFRPVTRSNLWAHESIPIPRSADPYLPDTMRDCDRLEFLPERFILKTARKGALQAKAAATDCRSANQWRMEDQLDARQVWIPASSSICPHCEGTVNNIPLKSAEKEELRQALYNVASRMHPRGMEYLQEFERFLQREKEFEYIIDGANVAYNNQNYAMERFSYGQVCSFPSSCIAFAR